MHRSSLPAVSLILLVFVFDLVVAQQRPQASQQTQLQLGVPIERSIAPPQAHVYWLNLEAGQFVQLVVEQRGIDVVMAVLGPERKRVGEYDSPNGDEGPENISFVVETTGTYMIAVRPLNQGEEVKPGKYEIRVLELRKATEQELSTLVDQEAQRAKAAALVKEASLSIPQIRSLPTRVHAQMKAAGLLWTTDAKTASKLMNDAVTSLQEFIGAIDYNDQESLQQLQPATVLRYELIQALAVHDPEAALNFLRATRPPISEEKIANMGIGPREAELEITLANQVAKKDPKRAFQIAEDSLKTGLSPNLFETVIQLLNTDPELGRKLAKDVNAKLLNEKLLKSHEASNLAIALLRSKTFPMRRFNAEALNTNGETVTSQSNTTILSDQDRRDLMQKALNEAISPLSETSTNSWNPRDAALNLLRNLKELGPELETQIPGSQVAIEKRVAEILKTMDPQRAAWQKYETVVNSNSAETLETISQSPPEMRGQLFQQLADRAAHGGDFTRARQIINERITSPWQRRQALANLEQQSIYYYIRQGKIEEALRALSVFRPQRARASIIAQIARMIGPGRKRAVGIVLLEQARSLLGDSPEAESQDEMNALLEIAIGFARYDIKRSFQIVDPVVDQFNEINEAARKLSGFGQESHKDGEVDFYNGNLVMGLASQISKALASLGTFNLEKARATADRIQAPEVRLLAYLEIAQQIIQPGRP